MVKNFIVVFSLFMAGAAFAQKHALDSDGFLTIFDPPYQPYKVYATLDLAKKSCPSGYRLPSYEWAAKEAIKYGALGYLKDPDQGIPANYHFVEVKNYKKSFYWSSSNYQGPSWSYWTSEVVMNPTGPVKVPYAVVFFSGDLNKSGDIQNYPNFPTHAVRCVR